jgi:hypothetical protein
MADTVAVYESALDSDDDDDGFALSIFCADPDAEGSRDAALTRAIDEGEIPNKNVRVAMLRDLVTGTGFKVVPRPPPPCHYHVILANVPSQERVDELIDLFGEPEPNPLRQRS